MAELKKTQNMTRSVTRITAALIAALTLSGCASAGQASSLDPAWLEQMEQDAMESGVSAQTVHAALDAFEPDPRVVSLDQKQPETTVTFATYRRKVVTDARIAKGAELMDRYAETLRALEARTGVPPQIVVALWGIESSFGRAPGDYETVTSLATLAYEGRRAEFFRGELIAALKILDREGLPAASLRGSWAGAMGQCQFMPSTYLKYAADGDGDGIADIWQNPADVMASIANYLAAEGWNRDLTWGRPVAADGVEASWVGLDKTRTLAEWAAAGVTNVNGTPLPRRDLSASLVQPDGADGDSFIVYDNTRAVMRWNRSTYFAMSVGLLADAIKAH